MTMRILNCLALLFPLIGLQAATFEQAAQEIVQVGAFLNQAKLCPATAGNFSMRLNENLIAVTASGKHKGELTADDILTVDLKGKVQGSNKKPSSETLLHTMLYTLYPQIGAVLHTHSVAAVVLSRLSDSQSLFVTEGYEIHKVFPGIQSHESRIETPIFENSQDMPKLAAKITAYLREHPNVYGFLLRGHGFYTWGRDMKEAKIRIEAFEHLFESETKLQTSCRCN